MANTITVVRERNTVLIRSEGMLDAAELIAFAREYRSSLKSLGEGVGRHAVLLDLTGSQVSPAATVEAFMAFLGDPRLEAERARRVAMVASSALFRMQLERVAAVRPGIRVFSDQQAAVIWLSEPETIADDR